MGGWYDGSEVQSRRAPRTVGRTDPANRGSTWCCTTRSWLPAHRWRAAVVASAVAQEAEGAAATGSGIPDDEQNDRPSPRRPGTYLWADLMQRTFGFDVLQSPRCGGRLRLLALIEHATTVELILRHLGLATDLPEARPARAPPTRIHNSDRRWDDGATVFDAC